MGLCKHCEQGQECHASSPCVPVLFTAPIDYSAANEYVRAHYDCSYPYFDHAIGGVADEPFHDGRALQALYGDCRTMLNDHGLTIFKSPLKREPDWTCIDDVQKRYLSELERILHQLFPSIASYCFWNPMIREESYGLSLKRDGETPTANVAPLAHIDTDVGAHRSISEFLQIVDKNKLQAPGQNGIKGMAVDIARGRKRFAVVNFWRNIGDAPVSTTPLGILSMRYDEPWAAFPRAHPDMQKSRWYVFPHAGREEVIVFYQYDRHVGQPSDLWHCAISANGGKATSGGARSSPPRKSFDVRALVVLNETVPEELDRYSANRIRPVLTFEESGCFCDRQAESRNKE